jgi:colicin import membrane protein
MREPDRDRWLSIGMSVLLHGTIIGLLAYGWWRYEHRPVTPSVSVDARVVDAQALNGLGAARRPAPQPKAPPPAPEPKPQAASPAQGPPAPTTAQELALRAQAAQAEAKRVAAAEAERERLKKQQAAAQAEARAEAEKLAQERRARVRAEKLAEQRRLALERKLAAERAAAARAARIAQLRQALAEDAQSNAKMRAATAGWISEVTQRVEAAWIKPPSARHNLSCIVHVTLVKGGAVAGASVGRCNGDEAVRESIEAAVYRASPLPPPPDPALYGQELNFVFAPNSAGEP